MRSHRAGDLCGGGSGGKAASKYPQPAPPGAERTGDRNDRPPLGGAKPGRAGFTARSPWYDPRPMGYRGITMNILYVLALAFALGCVAIAVLAAFAALCNSIVDHWVTVVLCSPLRR